MQVIPNNQDIDPDPDEDAPTDPEPIRDVLREALGRMTRREILNIRKAAERGIVNPAWLDKYYGDFLPIFSEAVGPVLSLHSKGIDREVMIQTILDSSRDQLRGAGEIGTILDGWESSKVEDILNQIETAR